jgi:hypothetical protein
MTHTLLLLAFIALSCPAFAQFFGGGAAENRVTFVLCPGSPCTAGTDQSNRFIVTAKKAKWLKCYITAKVAPSGGPLIVDVRKNAVSIFGATKLVFPADGAGVYTQSVFSSLALAEGDLISVDLLTIGPSTSGQDVTAVCTFK